ncbi:MAG: hypothetical protein LBT85_01750 [Bifidobacteriaceae bacterium]|nr:hypothetical protein [Bifidobacteriaceae bacterium]
MKKIFFLSLVFLLSLLVFGFILTFAANGSLYFSLLASNISLFDKFGVLAQIFVSIFSNIFQGVNGILVILLSLLQATTITLMVYAKKYSEAKTICRIGKDSGLQGAALIISFIGVGCPTCGTSLIAPLIALFASGISATYMNLVGNLILVISCLICAFAILNLLYQLKINQKQN